MKAIKRNMIPEQLTITEEHEHFPHCQASFNSEGNITLRNYDRSNKDKDEIIILSNSETEALFSLFSKIGRKCKNIDLPF